MRLVCWHCGLALLSTLLVSAACSVEHFVAPATTEAAAEPAAHARLILVSGATGRQGGATVRALLARGYQVRALTRHPESEKAQKLAALGVQISQGDLNDLQTLRPAVEGAYGVFSVQNFWEQGREGEIREGKNLADAAQAAGVKHFVYTSAGSVDRGAGIPHFESKWEIEKYLHTLSMPWTILRPVSFMENWEYSARESVAKRKISSPLSPTTRFQQISVDDIGRLAAEAFDHPDQWIGKTVEIAGDDRTMAEVIAAFEKATETNLEYVQEPWGEFEKAAGAELTAMYRWFESDGYQADVAGLRARYPFMTSFDAYLKQLFH